MLMLMLGVPAMACLTPETQLSQAEKTCCREMAGDCGHMNMPGAMPGGLACCQTTVKPPQAAIVKPTSNLSSHGTVMGMAPAATAVTLQRFVPRETALRPWRHPPPDAGTPTIQILRI